VKPRALAWPFSFLKSKLGGDETSLAANAKKYGAGDLMARINYGVDYVVDAKLVTDNVSVFVVTGPYPESEYECSCSGHYLLTLPITPRPPEFFNRVSCGEKVSESPVGELMLIPAGHTQKGAFRPQHGYRRDIHCLFPQHSFEASLGRVDWDPPTLTAAVDIRNSHIVAAVWRLAQEALTPGLASDVLADSIATAITIDISRYFGLVQRADEHESGGLSREQIRCITEYIHDHREKQLSLQQIAALCAMSVRHLARSFKRATGITVAEHIADVRLDIAKQLLRSSALAPKVIAARVGFSSVASFATAFRRKTGVTPGKFRQECSKFWRDTLSSTLSG
jgi:AraC family transcriptional regulator